MTNRRATDGSRRTIGFWTLGTAVLIAGLTVATPAAAQPASRLDRTLLVVPRDFLLTAEVPSCASEMFPDNARDFFEIEAQALLSCRRAVNRANRLRLDREEEITEFQKEVVEQRMRVLQNPSYPARNMDIALVDKLLEQADCDGDVWTGYQRFMASFQVEYRLLSRIVRVRNGTALNPLAIQCKG